MCFLEVSVQRFGHCQSEQMIVPQLLMTLPFVALEQIAFLPFHISVALHEDV